MENRKIIKFLIPILILGFFIFFQNAFAYEVGTHAFLTSEAVKFYNKNFSSKAISQDLIPYIVDGAILEDNMPRYLNHFYDPVNDRGLDDLGLHGKKSKDWARDKDSQTALLYRIFPQTEASLLSAIQIDKIKSTFKQTDFTWQKAIDLYAEGDTEASLFALGHILHLMEDAAVPDHTRNDAHPPYDHGGSPYENWTKQFDLKNPDKDLSDRLNNKKPIVLNDLNFYFEGMAKYSNNNFYSRDSMNNYELPKIKLLKGDDKLPPGYVYGLSDDGNGLFRLVLGRNPRGFEWLDSNSLPNNTKLSDSILDDVVVKDYWHRLSVKAVQNGAGVINLFFKEAEAAKEKYLTEKVQRPVLATFIDGFRNIFGSGPVRDIADTVNDLKLAKTIPLAKPKEVVEINKINTTHQTNIADTQDEDLAEQQQKQAAVTNQVIVPKTIQSVPQPISQASAFSGFGGGQGEITFSTCTFNTSKSPTHQNLIINEVAWMGGTVSANDEWFELKNISGKELDISGWQILDKAEQIKITISNGTKLSAGGFMLLERTDDNSVPGITADIIYVGALSNTDEGLRLFDNQCNLLDEAVANPDWPAGDGPARKTMERSVDLSWHTGVVSGTPKAENSQPLPTEAFSEGGPVLPPPSPPPPSLPPSPLKILISEAQITGGTGKTNNDFIELYNPNNAPINLNGYRLVKRTKNGTSDTSIKSWTTDVFIFAKGYYLWANSDFVDIAVIPDATTTATLANDNGIAIRFGAEDIGIIIDSVGWGEAQNNFVETQPFSENPIANQSISRKSENDSDNNAIDFIKSKPTPRNSNVSGGFLSPEPWSEPLTILVEPQLQSLGHLVISEIFIDMEGADTQEFVELYNSTDQAITLSGWSLQYLSGDATSTDKTVKKNFPNSAVIQPQSFYLVGTGGYSGSILADMTWSQSLNNTAATVFLVNVTSTIIDQIAYGTSTGLFLPEGLVAPLPLAGQSLERKAFYNNICTSAQAGGEFLGNGCDTNSNAGDFEIRSTPKPQNSKSLPEPRSAPITVQNFQASYGANTLGLSFNWDATSSLTYKLYDVSNASSTLLMATSTGQFSKNIQEIGRNYKFEITATDKEGLTSSSTQASVFVPSFLDNLAFYQDPRSSSSSPTYLLDLSWSKYPFVPIGDKWHTVVFYYNREAPVTDDLFWIDYSGIAPYKSWGLIVPGGFKISYSNCIGGTTAGSAVILPDASNYCDYLAGNHASYDLNWSQLEDRHLLLSAVSTNFASGTPVVDKDFVAAAFYTFQPGYEPNNYGSRLIAIDKTKHFLQSNLPVHQPPTQPQNLQAVFDPNSSLLNLSWDKSKDADTLDNLITYEINDGSTTVVTNNNSFSLMAGLGEVYNFAIKAKDEFGNLSDAANLTYSVPDLPLPYKLTNVQWGNLTSASSSSLRLDFSEYPFMDTSSSSAMLFFVNQSPPAGYSFFDDDYRNVGKIGGANNVLTLSYNTCDFQGWTGLRTVPGLILKNKNCPAKNSGLYISELLPAKIAMGDVQFSAKVEGEYKQGDYITLGFYQLGPRNNVGTAFFKNTVNYNKKIYFIY